MSTHFCAHHYAAEMLPNPEGCPGTTLPRQCLQDCLQNRQFTKLLSWKLNRILHTATLRTKSVFLYKTCFNIISYIVRHFHDTATIAWQSWQGCCFISVAGWSVCWHLDTLHQEMSPTFHCKAAKCKHIAHCSSLFCQHKVRRLIITYTGQSTTNIGPHRFASNCVMKKQQQKTTSLYSNCSSCTAGFHPAAAAAAHELVD